tara:strand:+ start:4334 stop:5281 length:948 start_codon:yes stop_codon:yes gene_type:complete
MFRKSIITSISSFKLSKNEESLIRDNKPWGIILFKRNIKDLKQLNELTSHIRRLMKDPLYPIMIDEEGGRVSRMSEIIDFSDFPQNYFGKLFEKNNLNGINSYKEYLHFKCEILKKSGININTIPVLDITKNNTHKIIGDRSYSKNIKTINVLKKICFKVLNQFKIGSVSKHIPGHGCSSVDTHKKLSIVNSSLNSLLKQDFKVFKDINSKFAMTAHIIYKRIDPLNTATHSKILIKNIIRKKLGFKGILISDDISMKALKGNFIYNAQRAIRSGCNLVLYCKGNFKESSILLNKVNEIDDFTKKKTSEFYKFLR